MDTTPYESPTSECAAPQPSHAATLPLRRSAWRVFLVVLLYLHCGLWLRDALCGLGVITWSIANAGGLPLGLLAVLSILRAGMGILFFVWARDVWKGCRVHFVYTGIAIAVIDTAVVAAIHVLR